MTWESDLEARDQVHLFHANSYPTSTRDFATALLSTRAALKVSWVICRPVYVHSDKEHLIR